MIHIILTILKVLGIILVVLLMLVLLLLAVILFVPVRYTIKADYHEKLKADVRAHWLLHLLRFKAVYDENGLRYKLKVLWFGLVDSEAEEKPPKPSKPSKSSKPAKTSKHSDDAFKIPDTSPSSEEKADNEAEVRAKDDESKTGEVKTGEAQNDETENDEVKDVKPGGLNDIIKRIRDFFVKLKDNIRNSYYKTVEFKNKAADKAEEISNFINDEQNIEFIRFMKRQLGITLAHIAPLKYNINIRFGADSPDVTGKVTGAVAVAMAFLKNDRKSKRKGTFDYIPVFDEKVIEADVFMKGRIRIFNILIVVWRVYRNDKFKELVLNK